MKKEHFDKLHHGLTPLENGNFAPFQNQYFYRTFPTEKLNWPFLAK